MYKTNFRINYNDYNEVVLFKIKIIIFITSLCFALITNFININITHLMYGSSGNIIYESTLASPDNVWYLNQIKNYLNGFGFTIDPLDPIFSVRRTPGYPLFYGLHYIIFGEQGAHLIIKYTQCLLHALASVFIFKTVFLLFCNLRISLLTATFYGLSPFIVSYLFLTITESIFPAMIVFTIYFAVASYVNNSLLWSLSTGIMMALVVLTSPRTGLTLFFLMQLVIYFNNLEKKKKIRNNLIIFVAFLATLSPWTIRNYILLDRFIPLETYYLNHTFEDQNIKLIALTRWWATWGSPTKDKLHSDMAEDLKSNNTNKTIDLFIDNEVPSWIYNVENKLYLRELLINYKNCMIKNIELNGGRRLRYLETPDLCEYQVSAEFDKFTEKIIDQYPFQVFIISPFYIRGMQYILHSGIHTWRSFDDYRSNPIKFILKGVAYVFNVLLWLFPVAYFISSRKLDEKILLGVVPLISFLFMIYYRHVEGRYLLGVYPFLCMMTAIFLSESLMPFIQKILSKNNIIITRKRK